MKHRLVFSQEWLWVVSPVKCRLGWRLRPWSSNNHGEKMRRCRGFCSASPYLLLGGVQCYLANPKLVKSQAQNYFQVRWPGHPCLQVVELWFDEFPQQRRGEPLGETPSVPAVATFITLYPHVAVPLRISPVEIMKPDLSSRRVSAGFTIITVGQKEPTPLCPTKRRNKTKTMKLCGRDKETIPAVSTMSCLWKLIKFSVMAFEQVKKKKKKWCKDAFLRYASPHVRMCMFTAGQITGRSSPTLSVSTWRTATTTGRWLDGQSSGKWQGKRELMRRRSKNKRKTVQLGGSASRF